MKWFRFYHEFMDDPKIAMMSDSDQLLWVKALCLASDNENNRGVITLSDEEICWKLRITVESWRHAIDKFRAKGMIEHCDGGYKITNWDKRQYKSDSSAERVAKHRRKSLKRPRGNSKTTQPKSVETEQSQRCNVTVTPSDTDSEQIQNTDPEEIKDPPPTPHQGALEPAAVDDGLELLDHATNFPGQVEPVPRLQTIDEVAWQRAYSENKPQQWRPCPISLAVPNTREAIKAAIAATGAEETAIKYFGQALAWVAKHETDPFWTKAGHSFTSLINPKSLKFLELAASYQSKVAEKASPGTAPRHQGFDAPTNESDYWAEFRRRQGWPKAVAQ